MHLTKELNSEKFEEVIDFKDRKNYLVIAEDILKETKRKLTEIEIWNEFKKKYGDQYVLPEGDVPTKKIYHQIYQHIERGNTKFFKEGTRPIFFGLSSLRDDGEYNDEEDVDEDQDNKIGNSDVTKKITTHRERKLHPFLTHYAQIYLNIYTKTIFHEKTKRQKGIKNEWLHPDLVGVRFHSIEKEYENEVIELSKLYHEPFLTIYSFEMKLNLDYTNLKDNYFQAVSNSTWANEGYIVAEEISTDDNFQNDLERLHSEFGIGIIKLDIENPENSNIILPSRYKPKLNWDTINRLCTVNPDIRSFLESIKNCFNGKHVNTDIFDRFFDTEELVAKRNEIL